MDGRTHTTDLPGHGNRWPGDDCSTRSDEAVRDVITTCGGTIFSTGVDSFWAVFDRPTDTAAAAAGLQGRFDELDWPGPELRVRAGVHLREAEDRGDDWAGPTLNSRLVALRPVMVARCCSPALSVRPPTSRRSISARTC